MDAVPGYGYGIKLEDIKLCGELELIPLSQVPNDCRSLLPSGVQFIGILDSGDPCIGLPGMRIGYSGESPINKFDIVIYLVSLY